MPEIPASTSQQITSVPAPTTMSKEDVAKAEAEAKAARMAAAVAQAASDPQLQASIAAGSVMTQEAIKNRNAVRDGEMADPSRQQQPQGHGRG